MELATKSLRWMATVTFPARKGCGGSPDWNSQTTFLFQGSRENSEGSNPSGCRLTFIIMTNLSAVYFSTYTYALYIYREITFQKHTTTYGSSSLSLSRSLHVKAACVLLIRLNRLPLLLALQDFKIRMFSSIQPEPEDSFWQKAKHSCGQYPPFFIDTDVCTTNMSTGFCTLCSLKTSLGVAAMSEKSCQRHIVTRRCDTWQRGQKVSTCHGGKIVGLFAHCLYPFYPCVWVWA